LSEDPTESTNLYPASRFSWIEEKASKYYVKMDKFYKQNRQKIEGEVAKADIEESVFEQLKTLGYM
jgi:hypothetical protein